MLNQFKDYAPVIEIAVLKSMGEAGEAGKRDVLIKVEALSEDRNPVVKSVSIEGIENANLSLKMLGFDLYASDEVKGVKVLSGVVKVIASINNGTENREYTLHTPEIEVQPINLKDGTFPPIMEVKNTIERAWLDAFSDALSDIIDQTTVITGNLKLESPYSLDAEKVVGKSDADTSQASSKKFWIGVVVAAVVVFISTMLLINYFKKSNEEPVPVAETQQIEQVSGNNPGVAPTESPQATPQPQTESEAIESEVLDEFGLESNVSLD
jgi:hypothetical protein